MFKRLKADLGVWKFFHKATSRFCSQCQLGFQRNTSKKRYLQMAKKWLNTGCSYLIYTFHLGMFRKSSAAPTRKDIGAGGAVWTYIATHVFNYTKHLLKSSMIKRICYNLPSIQFFCKMSTLFWHPQLQLPDVDVLHWCLRPLISEIDESLSAGSES